MTSASDDPRRVLARHGLTAKKSWGQNFLRDRAVLGRIAASARAEADDVVVEIGSGLGALTAALAALDPPPARILAVERDPDMLRVLAAELAEEPRVELAPGDAAQFDFAAASRTAGRPLIVVGNLPYQIASALILAVIDAGRAGAVARAVVMVQREMAQRVVAPSGNKIYGRFSVAMQQRAAVRILFHVSPGAFHPPPQVTSSVLWETSMRYLLSQGFTRFIELGPGSALSGFMKRIDKTAQMLNVSDVASLEATVKALG